MDLIGADKSVLIEKLQSKLSNNCIDFSRTANDIVESSASCSESLMEKYLSDEAVRSEDIANAIRNREIFPCFFGSALKTDGIDEFISVLYEYTVEPKRGENFGAKVFKISYDAKGTRLTHLKIMGGQLNMRDEISYNASDGEKKSEKISSIRFYTGDKFRNAETAFAGEVCAVTGLMNTFAGQGIGSIKNSERAYIEPVMTYRVIIPNEKNVYDVLKDMRRLEDEDPQLHIVWNEQKREVHIQLMGSIQLEVLTREISEKFGYQVDFCDGEIARNRLDISSFGTVSRSV